MALPAIIAVVVEFVEVVVNTVGQYVSAMSFVDSPETHQAKDRDTTLRFEWVEMVDHISYLGGTFRVPVVRVDPGVPGSQEKEAPARKQQGILLAAAGGPTFTDTGQPFGAATQAQAGVAPPPYGIIDGGAGAIPAVPFSGPHEPGEWQSSASSVSSSDGSSSTSGESSALIRQNGGTTYYMPPDYRNPGPEKGRFESIVAKDPILAARMQGVVEQAKKDPKLQEALNKLNEEEVRQLVRLLDGYGKSVSQYLAATSRITDVIDYKRSSLEAVYSTVNGIVQWDRKYAAERGCAQMAEAGLKGLVPLATRPDSAWQLYKYDWVPGADRQYVAYGGLPIAGAAIGHVAAGALAAKLGVAGTIVGGPLLGITVAGIAMIGGTIAGAYTATNTNNSEHHMIVLQSKRDATVMIVLDPYAAVGAGPESLHGEAYHTEWGADPVVTPVPKPAAPAPAGILPSP